MVYASDTLRMFKRKNRGEGRQEKNRKTELFRAYFQSIFFTVLNSLYQLKLDPKMKKAHIYCEVVNNTALL